MGRLWLHDLPRWLESDKRLTVVRVPGWETRSRSSGGYEDVRAVIMHHDASGSSRTDAELVDYLFRRHQYAPVSALYLGRTGTWYVGAAGATNCAGKGGPLTTSKGRVPVDDGNRWTLSIEAGNNGIGEPWRDEMVESYLTGVGILVRELGLQVSDVHTHNSYVAPTCPGRKIDPRGPTPRFPQLGGATRDTQKIWAPSDIHPLVQERIVVPPQPFTGPVWETQPGDTWDIVAARVGRTVAEVAAANRVLPSYTLPARVAIPDRSYRVAAGEGWWTMARQAGCSIEQIQAANPGVTLLHPGDVVVFPGYAAPPGWVCPLPTTTMMEGASGPPVEALQRWLSSRGLYPYTVDGRYGPRTKAGVGQFQIAMIGTGVYTGTVDGVYSQATITSGCLFLQREAG